MNPKMWFGSLMVVGSWAQLLVPRRLLDQPTQFFHGYPVIPANLLALTTTLFALGVIILSEGVCQRFGAPSLWYIVTRDVRMLLRVAFAAATAGLVMELCGQWIGKLWIYPYWTPWFYWLVLLPGFIFYWAAIVESYLAVKAVLDGATRQDGNANSRHGPVMGQPRRALFSHHLLGAIGAVLLLVVAWLDARWYMAHGGYVFLLTVPIRDAPPFVSILLALVGTWLAVEWWLRHRNVPSLVGSLRQGYWIPAVAVIGSSLVLSFVMESQNTVHHYWAYTHFPGPIALFGLAASVFAAWPLQYVAFLLIPTLFAPALATQFWCRPGPENRSSVRRR